MRESGNPGKELPGKNRRKNDGFRCQSLMWVGNLPFATGNSCTTYILQAFCNKDVLNFPLPARSVWFTVNLLL